MKTFLAVVIIILVGLLSAAPVFAQKKAVSNRSCSEWDKKVDPSLGTAAFLVNRPLGDDETLSAIGCLLRHQHDERPANFSGSTRPEVSQFFPDATIELASLYYISYLYTGNWLHGDAIALWNEGGEISPPGATITAYNAYDQWFKRVKTGGLASARKEHLDPLAGTGLAWYGKPVRAKDSSSAGGHQALIIHQ